MAYSAPAVVRIRFLLAAFDRPDEGGQSPASGGSADWRSGGGGGIRGPRWWQSIRALAGRVINAILRSRWASAAVVGLLVPPGVIVFLHGGSVQLIANAANLGAIGGGLLAALHGLRRRRGIRPGGEDRPGSADSRDRNAGSAGDRTPQRPEEEPENLE